MTQLCVNLTLGVTQEHQTWRERMMPGAASAMRFFVVFPRGCPALLVSPRKSCRQAKGGREFVPPVTQLLMLRVRGGSNPSNSRRNRGMENRFTSRMSDTMLVWNDTTAGLSLVSAFRAEADDVKAEFKVGVLRVHLAKSEKACSKQIEVKVS